MGSPWSLPMESSGPIAGEGVVGSGGEDGEGDGGFWAAQDTAHQPVRRAWSSRLDKAKRSPRSPPRRSEGRNFKISLPFAS